MTAMLTIRRPTAPPPDIDGAPAFALNGSPKGVRIGIRAEPAWRSWLFISALWSEWLERDGARIASILTGERSGTEGAKTRTALDAWAKDIDAAVVGIGT
jgi:hypothetical protein